jgi:tetratricopeptide (TPR) repeat protein
MRREFGWPLVELGNIRLRLGDLDGAEDAFLQAHRRSWPALPGIALLRMEQGDLTAAEQLITDAVNDPPDLPWKERPPFGDLRLVPLLDAQSEIAYTRGDATTAAQAAAALRTIAARFAGKGLAAVAALATARARLLARDYSAAIAEANAAVVGWCELDAPYEAAVARVVLGCAYAAAGNAGRSRLDWQAAHAEFVSFGAVRRVEETAALLAQGPHPQQTTLSATMARTGDRWHVAFRDSEIVLADLKGLQYLAVLLGRPGEEVRALDLCGGHEVAEPVPVIDEPARAAYRRRLQEVDQDIAEAQGNNDIARAEQARRDREFLLVELSGAVGLGGRLRGTGGAAERARTSVTRSLRYALDRLADHDHVLGEHLKTTVRTGSCCSYTPDPVAPISWTVTY